MSWVDVLWPMMGAASLTLAVIHAFVFAHQRGALEHLWLVCAALAVAALTILELRGMRTTDPVLFGETLRYAHVPLSALAIALVWMVRARFGAGPVWIAWVVTAVRLASLVPNFATGVDLNFIAVHAMQRIDLLGETLYVPVGEPNPWAIPGQVSNVLLVWFMASAALTVWRRGDAGERARALAVCGSVALFVLASAAVAFLANRGVLHLPFLVSAGVLCAIVAMSYDLGGAVVRSAESARRLARSEARLRESEERMALAAEAAQIAMFNWDVHQDRIWVNERGLALFAFPVDRPVGMADLIQRMHPDDRARVRSEMERSLEAGSTFERSYRLALDDGRTRWIEARGRIERAPDGRPLSLHGIAVDQSARRQAEERFRVAVEAAPSGMLLVDARGRIVLCNRRAELIFGYARDAIEGRALDPLLPGGLEAQPVDAPPELHARRGDGRSVRVEVGVSPIESSEGPLLLVAVNDISDRLQREQHLAEQRERLAHVTRVGTLGELAGSLAHDMNQPLAVILSNAQAALRMLRQGGDARDVCDALEDVVAADHRAAGVIQRLRALLARAPMELRALDLNELVQEVLLLQRSELLQRRIAVDLDLAADLPPVLGDRVQLQQVVLNLLTNAREALDGVQSPRRIGIRTERGAGGAALASIRDAGGGLREAELERVFQPFVSGRSGGLGLGLTVCRSILDAHRGRIWAERDPDGGACFRFELPTAI